MKALRFRRIISLITVAALLMGLAFVIPADAANLTDHTFILFNNEDVLDITTVNNTKLSIDKERYAMKVDPVGADPLVRFDYKAGGLSTAIYKYLTLIYEVDADNVNTSYTQFFFTTSDSPYESPTACYSFNAKKGDIACEIVDLSEASYWTGNIATVRLDTFQTYTAGEYMYVYGIGLSATREEAQAYASQFIPEKPDTVILGDINFDSTVSAKDSVLMSKYIAGSLEVENSVICDANDDGAVNAQDCLHIKRLIVGNANNTVKEALHITKGRYVPGTLLKDTEFSLSGTVRSDFTVNEVSVKVTDSTGENVYFYSVSEPYADEYDIGAFNSSIPLSSLAHGSYRLQIIAADGLGVSKLLVDNPFKVHEKSILTISAGNYNPVSINEGGTYSISGTISSNFTLTKVVLGVFNADGTPTSQVVTVNPNAKTYDIKEADNSIKFGALEQGNYYFQIAAADTAEGLRMLVSSAFTVIGENDLVAAFQQRALSTWIKPVRAKILSVVGTGRGFGAYRTATRQHAGIDYYVSGGSGTPVYAMQSGVVVEYLSNFYYGTNSVAVQHADGSVARYCEISTSLRVGDTVTQGQQIATIIGNTLDGGTMLHLELYLGTATGSLSRTNSTYDYVTGSYNRRRDIVNPEFLLNLKN